MIFRLPDALRPLFLGVLSGLLPCPLVYAFCAVGAASGSVIVSIGLLATLGLGTVPALTVVAASGAHLSGRFRRGLLRVSGCLLIALALYTLARSYEAAPCCSV